MSRDALPTSTYPFPIIRIVCAKCARSGQYRCQTLTDRFGPDTDMPEVLEELAQCPDRRLLLNLLPIIAFALKLGLLLAEKVGA